MENGKQEAFGFAAQLDGVEFYSSNRIEYSVNLNELINSKQIND